jgi:DNA-binding transcriptional ArsR family regulator
MSRRSSAAANLTHAAPVFAALGDETRLALVSRLGSSGPLSITRLTDGSKVTRQAITKHLEILSQAGLVRDERRGRERLWMFEGERLEQARRCLEQISSQWDEALERLKNFVEE